MMGDLRSVGGDGARAGNPVGDYFAGSRRQSAIVTFDSFDRVDAIEASKFVANMSWEKSIDGSAGSITIRLRSRLVRGTYNEDRVGGGVNWSSTLRDGDFVRVSVHDGAFEWALAVGIVDSVTKSVQSVGGAVRVEYLVSARDLTRALEDTEFISMPYAGYDPLLAAGSFYGAVAAMSLLGWRNGPGPVVTSLFRHMMRHPNEGRETLWRAVPPSLPAFFSGGVVPEAGRRQVSDLIDIEEWVADDLPGTFAAYGSLLAKPGAGGRAWDLMLEHANTPLNECFIDLRPPVFGEASALAYAATTEEGYDVRPSLILRERPFPSLPGSSSHRGDNNDPWSDLPTTIIDARDFSSLSLSRDGSERYNYFFVESGTGANLAGMVVGQASLQARGGVAGARLFDGVPAIDTKSVERHGLRRMEQSTLYMNLTSDPDAQDTGALEIYAGWTRLLRDWYALNHEFLTGTGTLPMMLAGIRVGERVRIDNIPDEPAPVFFYVEGVSINFAMMDTGAAQYSTELTLTRGHPDVLGALAEHIVNFRTERGGSPLLSALTGGWDAVADEVAGLWERMEAAAQLSEAEAEALLERIKAAESATGDNLDEEDAPDAAGVQGEDPDGDPFDVPEEVD